MFSRSLRLARASLSVINAQRELLVLPVISGVALVVAVTLVAVPTYLFVFAAGGSDLLGWLAAALVTYVAVAVSLFFQTAMVAATAYHMDGGNPSLGWALRAAGALLPQILGWSVLVTVVKMFVRWLRDRGWLGRLAAGVVDGMFTFATFITVPVLVAERVGPMEALKRSASLLRSTWGENIVGRVGLGVVAVFGYLAGVGVLAVGVFVAMTSFTAGVVLVTAGVLVVVAVAMFSAAFNAVYQTALYRYAVGQSVEGFAELDLEFAYRRKLAH